MRKSCLIFQLFFVFVLTACGLQPIPIDDDSVILDPAVSIVFPLDQAIIPPYHAAVVAVASLPSGISDMAFSIDGNPPAMFDFPQHKIGTDYIELHAYFFPYQMGSTILSVIVYDMNGQPALSDQIEVFVEFGDPVDNGPVETYVAQTLTAIAENQDEVFEPSPTYTLTPELGFSNSEKICELFEDHETRLTLHDIQPGSNRLTFFLTFEFEVPGLEKRDVGDERVYSYHAQMGGDEEVECSYQGYTRRLYCSKTIPDLQLDSVQPLTVTLNLCENPIYTHSRVSLIAPVCTVDSSEGTCEAFGGSFNCIRGTCSCTCP